MKVPVPYVAYWSDEIDKPFAVRRDPRLHDEWALFSQGTPTGKPVLGKMNEQRQREVVLDGKCQVCAAPIKRSRWLVSFGEHENGKLLVREPWSCTGCMVAAVRYCPGIRQAADRPLLLLRKWELALTYTSVPDGTEKPDDAPDTVWGMVKIIPIEADAYNHEEFLAKYGSAPCKAKPLEVKDHRLATA